MEKFNLKEHIAKNKATFFGSLTEGQFSWMTQDTGQQIGSQDENKIPVYMFDDKGKYYYENDYDGYGVFGGMDYYELLDKMNDGSGNRKDGIDLAFGKLKRKNGEPVLFPALVTDPYKFNYKTHDFTQEEETDPNQSWYEPEEDDYIVGDDDDEDFGYNDDEEELDENINKDASSVAEKFAQYMSKKEGKTFTVTPDSVDEKSFDLDVDGLEYEGGSYLIKDNGDIINVAITPNEVYGNVNQLEEGEAAYEYEKGKKAGEKIEKNKMKKSELKAKIKEMILAEYEKDVDYTDETSGYDFLAELEGMLDEAEDLTPLQQYIYDYESDISGEDFADEELENIKTLNTPEDVYRYYAVYRGWEQDKDFKYDLENIYKQVKRKFKNLSEADETEKDTAEVDTTDVAVDNTETISTSTEVEVDPDVKAVQDALTQAQVAAQKLGDKKLMDQIGNTITFFTRAHVVDKGAVAEGEKEPYSGKSDKDFYSDIENQYKNYKAGVYDKLKNKEYYKDAEADDAEHIDALEKDMKDDKKASKMKVSELKAKIKEVVFPMWTKLNK